MLIEHRAYTLRPDSLDAFMQAQIDRGFEPVRPIFERLIGYFAARSGPEDQVVHLYRYDSYDDWVKRLHGLYGVPSLEPYFKTVRPLMLAQENKFLAPAPIAELTPVWGNGKDWLPADGPLFANSSASAGLVEESTRILLPGSLPVYWQAWREHGLAAGELATENLLGCFVSVVGRQHQVIQYRRYAGFEARQTHRDALARNDRWRTFQRATSPLCASSESKLFSPAQIAQMSPLFGRG